MRFRGTALLFALLALAGALCHAQAAAKPISKEVATQIALSAAGCKKGDDCIAKGHLNHGQWVFVVTFVAARDASGNPLVAPGGWMGITLDSNGNVVEKMPGE
jgi:hypothetical protein